MLREMRWGMALTGVILVTSCSSGPLVPTVTTTVTATSAPRVLTFDPATSGKVLAARLAARAKPSTLKDKITGVECRDFSDIKVGAHTSCQLKVNGVKKGFLVTFTTRDGHYVVKSQTLTW